MHGHDCHFQSVARKSRQSRTRRPVPITTVTLNAKPLPFWAAPRTDFRPAELAIQKSTATAGPAVQAVAECVGQSADHVGRGVPGAPRKAPLIAVTCLTGTRPWGRRKAAAPCGARRGVQPFAFNAKMTGPRPNFLLAHPVNKSRGPRASGSTGKHLPDALWSLNSIATSPLQAQISGTP